MIVNIKSARAGVCELDRAARMCTSTTRGRHITDTYTQARIHRNSDFLVVMITVGLAQAHLNNQNACAN